MHFFWNRSPLRAGSNVFDIGYVRLTKAMPRNSRFYRICTWWRLLRNWFCAVYEVAICNKRLLKLWNVCLPRQKLVFERSEQVEAVAGWGISRSWKIDSDFEFACCNIFMIIIGPIPELHFVELWVLSLSFELPFEYMDRVSLMKRRAWSPAASWGEYYFNNVSFRTWLKSLACSESIKAPLSAWKPLLSRPFQAMLWMPDYFSSFNKAAISCPRIS